MIETESVTDTLTKLHKLFGRSDEETERVLQELRERSQNQDKEQFTDTLAELRKLFGKSDEETKRVLQELKERSQNQDKEIYEYLKKLEEFLNRTT